MSIIRNLARPLAVSALIATAAGTAAAQTDPTPVPPGNVQQEAPAGDPRARAATANGTTAPVTSIGTTRFFVDTGVSDVRVEGELTVATLNRSPRSPCPSNQYVYERERPKWLLETGRLMQAMREGATVRISFTCRNGYQSINAIQFIPAPRAVATTPQDQDGSAYARNTAAARANAGQARRFPVPGTASQEGLSATERARRIPLP